MKTPVGNVQNNQSQAAANQPARQQGHDGVTTQRELQEAANNSAQVQQLKAYQAMANDRATTVVQPKAANTNLPGPLRSGIESLSGYSMDDVKVHYNSDKPAQLNALAYAQGTDIHIASGQEKHLPHEAWHVVQQKQGRVQPTLQMKGEIPVNDDKGLETEADTMGAKALTVPAENDQEKELSTVDTGGTNAVQRVRGGIEYTEHGGTELRQWQPSTAAGIAAHNVAPQAVSVGGSYVTFYAVPANTYADDRKNDEEQVALRAGPALRMENDLVSAEWIIERHTEEYSKDEFIARIGEDWIALWNRREALRLAVAAQQGAHGGSQIVFREGSHNANLTETTAERVFKYQTGNAVGSVQVTLGYKGGAAIENIALSNVAGYMAGAGDNEATRRERVGGTKPGTWLLDSVGTANQWMNAKSLRTALATDMAAVEPGTFSTIFSTEQLATVQLMVLMDTMSRRASDDVGEGAEATAKNIQRFFPKSVRDSYVREMLGANVTNLRMTTIRARLTAAIDASVAKFYAAIDTDRLPAAAYMEAHDDDAAFPGVQAAAHGGNAQAKTAYKEHMLGDQGAFSATALDIIKAYTDTSADSSRQHRGNDVNNGHEYVISGKAAPVIPRGNGAVFEDRAEVVMAGGNLGTWEATNPLKLAVLSLLRGTT